MLSCPSMARHALLIADDKTLTGSPNEGLASRVPSPGSQAVYR